MALVTRHPKDISRKVTAATIGAGSSITAGEAIIYIVEYFTNVDYPPLVQWSFLVLFGIVVTFLSGYIKRDSVPDAIAVDKTPADIEKEFIDAAVHVNTGAMPTIDPAEKIQRSSEYGKSEN